MHHRCRHAAGLGKATLRGKQGVRSGEVLTNTTIGRSCHRCRVKSRTCKEMPESVLPALEALLRAAVQGDERGHARLGSAASLALQLAKKEEASMATVKAAEARRSARSAGLQAQLTSEVAGLRRAVRAGVRAIMKGSLLAVSLQAREGIVKAKQANRSQKDKEAVTKEDIAKLASTDEESLGGEPSDSEDLGDEDGGGDNDLGDSDSDDAEDEIKVLKG
jgi:hypothetical protein